MLKRLLAYLLVFSIVSASFSRFFVYAGFALNQKYIASTLCENKDKPQLHCEGKCYLMKKVKLAEEKEKDAEQSSQKGKYQEALLTSTTLLQLPEVSAISNFALHLPGVTIAKSFSIFHPPSQV